nr:isthmin-1 isoform X2 [Anas platyrhynchos]
MPGARALLGTQDQKKGTGRSGTAPCPRGRAGSPPARCRARAERGWQRGTAEGGAGRGGDGSLLRELRRGRRERGGARRGEDSRGGRQGSIKASDAHLSRHRARGRESCSGSSSSGSRSRSRSRSRASLSHTRTHGGRRECGAAPASTRAAGGKRGEMEPGPPAETPPARGPSGATCRPPPPASAGTVAAAVASVAASRPDVAPPWGCGPPRCCCCCCCRRCPDGGAAPAARPAAPGAPAVAPAPGTVVATAAAAAAPPPPPPPPPRPPPLRGPKAARLKRMVRLAAELLLLLGLLLLTLHITVLRGGGEPQGPGNHSQRQVTIEVVDGPDTETDKDLQKESSKPSWPVPSPDWRNWWQRSSTLTRMSSGDQDYKYDSTTEDSNFLSPLGGWDSHAPSHRTFESKEQPEYDYIDGEGDWSPWSLCSVTCGSGNQKRTRSCGYACTATESRSCDRPNCPGIEDTFRTAATEVSLLAGSEDFNATKLFEVDTDSCERWMSCKSEFLKKYMHKVVNDLPSCPCSYPREVAYSTAEIYDRIKRKNFRWKDASGPKEKLEIYKPTARYCIRSMLSLESTTLAAQHCCYDDNMQLITRGKGAGTPNLISIEFSAELHYKVDILPWIICKGDWSRYNEARPPNNGQKCTENPSDEDYYKQFQEAREY